MSDDASSFRQPIGWLRALPARILLAAIRGYQRAISPWLRVVAGPVCGCRFAPSCSHYALAAVQEHGAGRGAWLAFCRLMKCTPFHAGGFDPVPARANSRPRCSRMAA